MAMMLLNNPELEMRIYGEDYEPIADFSGGEEYDALFKKWRKRRASRRAKKPRVMRRRRRRDLKRMARGKKPRYPQLVKDKLRPKPKAAAKRPMPIKALIGKNIPAALLQPKDAVLHKRINRAIQEELKTKQEEQRAIGLKKKVEQEELKAANLKAQTQLAGTGKMAVVLIVLIGGGWALSKVMKGKKPLPAPSA